MTPTMPDTVSLKTREAIAQNVNGQEVQVLSKSFSCAEVWEVLKITDHHIDMFKNKLHRNVFALSVLRLPSQLPSTCAVSVSCTTLNSCFGYAVTAPTQKIRNNRKKTCFNSLNVCARDGSLPPVIWNMTSI